METINDVDFELILFDDDDDDQKNVKQNKDADDKNFYDMRIKLQFYDPITFELKTQILL